MNLIVNSNCINKMNLSTAFATQQGVSHRISDTPCQDSVLVKQEDSYLFLGLADGAGSAKYSDIGSKLILRFLSMQMQISFEYYKRNAAASNKELLEKIHLALISIADVKKIKVKDLSSTLLFIAVYYGEYMVVHIGDGVVGILDEDDNLSVLSEPENGEFSHYTYFTTSLDSNRVRVYRGDVDKLNGLILMSDGVEESLYNYKTKTLAPITTNIIKWLDNGTEEEVSSALDENLKNVFAIKSSDDLSIAILRHHKDGIKCKKE